MGSQREHNPGGYEDSFTVLLHYEGMLATAKAAVVSPEENQLRYWVRGVDGSYKKVCVFRVVPVIAAYPVDILPSGRNDDLAN